jgi:cysteine synthase
VRWRGSARSTRIEIFGKAEYFNPGGSVKDVWF